MKERTNSGRLKSASGNTVKTMKSWAEFLADNRLLLLFTLVFLAGVLIGVMVFSLSNVLISDELATILEVRVIIDGFKGGITALFSSCFSTLFLLSLLFVLGLSACGAPFASVVPLFFGMGLGLTEAYYASLGFKGMVAAAILIIPHYIIAATALLFGSMESIHMSVLLSRQLLPNGGIGGLWQDFKLYCVRFLVYFCIAFASGVADVCLRLLFGKVLL
ncbi:MAG: hypothetical protein PHH84_04070 [Oscillospiraceae bacterium]|nr:hypothetical protein [Oscillospiraceae bacterium]